MNILLFIAIFSSRRYNRLKLMIVGVQGIGKTSLLQQIRLEGTVNKRGPSNDVSFLAFYVLLLNY